MGNCTVFTDLIFFLPSATTSHKRGALEVESYAVKVNTPITHTGVTRLGKLLQITLQGDDSVTGSMHCENH